MSRRGSTPSKHSACFTEDRLPTELAERKRGHGTSPEDDSTYPASVLFLPYTCMCGPRWRGSTVKKSTGPRLPLPPPVCTSGQVISLPGFTVSGAEEEKVASSEITHVPLQPQTVKQNSIFDRLFLRVPFSLLFWKDLGIELRAPWLGASCLQWIRKSSESGFPGRGPRRQLSLSRPRSEEHEV